MHKTTKAALRWFKEQFGRYTIVDDETREHPGERSRTLHLQTADLDCYLKILRDEVMWGQAVHGYEQWAPTLRELSPTLLGVKEDTPKAIVISALPGTPLERTEVDEGVETAVYQQAGTAIAQLHALPKGQFFGACTRTGDPVGDTYDNGADFIYESLKKHLTVGQEMKYLNKEMVKTVQRAMTQSNLFGDERPTACHRDFCPPNWLVKGGLLCGVIDYEFSHWDCWTADFSRYPSWDWITRPELLDAQLGGYGRRVTAVERKQLWVAQVLYAVGAVVWGMQNSYRGFAADGRRALTYLSSRPTRLFNMF